MKCSDRYPDLHSYTESASVSGQWEAVSRKSRVNLLDRAISAREKNWEVSMLRRTLLAATLLVAISAPALAGHCPADVKAIDNALPKMSLSAAQKAEVTTLRNEGEALHKAGNHNDSQSALAKAMRIILNAQ